LQTNSCIVYFISGFSEKRITLITESKNQLIFRKFSAPAKAELNKIKE